MDENNKILLKLENISKSFAKVENDEVTHALDCIDLEMRSGEFISLVGPSGCGKSTILRLVAGLIQPTLGKVTVNEKEITGPSPERGMVFQKPTLFPWLTVEKNIAFPLKMQGRLNDANGKEKVEHMLHVIGLEGFRDDYPGQLSGGMAQRVALVRTLISQPEILLLDEPLGALDAFTRMNMQDEILSMWREHRQLAHFDLNNDGQIEMGQDGVEVEVNISDVHMNASEAFAAGKWEALFTPVDIPGRFVDMEDFDLTPTEEEKAAMEKEPAYGKPVLYYMSDGCTSGPTVADDKGYYEEAGLTAEGFKGTSYIEALGTQQATVAVGHIATMLVPITNSVDITFVGGAHIGCKSLYALADSEYNTTEDLKGTQISVPNGIGASDYNITSLLLDADGIDPLKGVTLTQVSSDACIAAMERGEISAALLSDTFAYAMMKEGKLKCVRSLQDEDFAKDSCCVIAMNRTFVQENPVIAKKITQAVQKAHSWMHENPEDATQLLLDRGWNGGDYDMNVMINNALQFGLSDEFTGDSLKRVIEKYVRLGLITATDDVDGIYEMAWTPVL